MRPSWHRGQTHATNGHAERRALLAALVFVAAVQGAVLAILWPAIAPVNDVVGFIAGGRAILEGVDPYDAQRWVAFATAVGQRPETPVFGYPPWVALAFAPLAALPTAAASLVWTVGTFAAALAAVILLGGRLGWPLVPTTIAAGASWPAMLVLLQGQWGFALFALAAVSIAALAARRDLAAGAAFGAMVLAKPQLFVLAAIGAATWAIARRRPRLIAGCASVIVAGAVLGTLAAPGWLEPYARWVLLPRSGRSTQQPTLAGLAGDLAGPAWPVLWVALIVALAALAAAAVRAAPERHRTGLACGAGLALSLAAAPYSWSYDHYLVVPLAATVLGIGSDRGANGRASVFAALAVLLGPIAFVLWESAYVRWHDTAAGLVPPLVIGLAWLVTRSRARPPDRASGQAS